jgi:CheY-like chemotaxis protein
LVRHHGHHADYVDNGFKALDYLSSQHTDLVILDVMMPEIDGLEVLQRVRRNPQTANVPVVMFSALSDPQFTQRARDIGANDYWVKASLDFQSLGHRLAVFLPPTQQAD